MRFSFRLLCAIACFVSVTTVLFRNSPEASATEPVVRVSIIDSASSLEIEPATGFTVSGKEASKTVEIEPSIRYTFSPSSKSLSLIEPGGHKHTFESEVRIRSESESAVLSVSLPGQAERDYRGQFIVRATRRGRIELDVVLPMEDYLCGVLPLEMGTQVPLEALKAQAVAARTKALFELNGKKAQQDGLSSGVGTQRYEGLGNEDSFANEAVRSTRGLILTWNGHPIDAVYASNCGGHTESAVNVWSGGGASYLQGHFDGPGSAPLNLSREEGVRKWIFSEQPLDTYCSTEHLPEWAMRNYRWTMRLDAEQMRRRVSLRKNIGRIKRIIPLKRGVSGRLVRVKFEGESGNLVTGPELAIRWLFKPSLPSSAFVVLAEGSGEYPDAFILKGAGHGHGVGMCQCGAIGMALRGKGFHEILEHYYRGTAVEKRY